MGSHCSSLDDILEEDMHHWYTKFMRESPSGLITLFELKTMLEMNGMTEEASSYVDQVFFTFDMDGVRKYLKHNSSSLLRKKVIPSKKMLTRTICLTAEGTVALVHTFFF